MDAIPTYLKAATLLEPKGNVAAETAAVVEKLKPGILGALPGAGSGIKLLKPRRQVAARLDDLIVRGTALLEDVNKSPATLPERLDQKSRDWDTWRGYAEQSIVELFTPPAPLQWLKEIKPRHLNFQKPPAQRAKELPRDIENELAFFRNLAGRLDNYPETTRR